jgi:hypothetical protein
LLYSTLMFRPLINSYFLRRHGATEAAQILFWEYIYGIFVAVCQGVEGHTVQLLLPAVQAQITLVTKRLKKASV